MAQYANAKEHRDRLERWVNRARQQPRMMQELRDDPVGVLRREGLSDEAIGDVLREESYQLPDPNDPSITPRQREGAEMIRSLRRQGGGIPCWDECCLTCVCTDCCITVL
jgi:hypothetical protein